VKRFPIPHSTAPTTVRNAGPNSHSPGHGFYREWETENASTEEAVGDWHYWVRRGCGL